MELPAPITITVDSTPLTLTRFDTIFIDDPTHKRAVVRLHSALRFLELWRDDAYAAAGDWTQAQAEARILELLTADPQATLQALVISS
jgi:hypothetical protein